MKVIELRDDRAIVQIVPDIGAAVGRYDAIVGGKAVPILRPWSGTPDAHPFSLASNLLLPWSNRISGGGFDFDGQFRSLTPNFEGETCPIHGNGFSEIWIVENATTAKANLSLVSNGPEPFTYRATVIYELTRGALAMTLDIGHLGPLPLPYGLGFHPWFIRTPETKLCAKASGVWLEDEAYLPTHHVDLSAKPEWNFSRPAQLPAGWINNAFIGWGGIANIEWPDRSLFVQIDASPNMPQYLLYSPSAKSDFFCFEPVTHPVDAHNLPGGAIANGLARLSQGEHLSATMSVSWMDA
jgi:aldose 1-epimerase